MAPWAALGAIALALAPLLWAGAEKEIVAVTSTEMVDRSVPTTVTYVGMPGLAMNVGLAAPGSSNAPPYGLLVRDTADADAVTIVSSDIGPAQLATRWVVGRVTTRDTAAAAAFAARGESTDGLDPALWLVEVPPPDDEPIQEVAAAADLAGLPDETLVRILLTFAAESIPTCALAEDGCAHRSLAVGDGIFVHLAHGTGEPDPILVRTTYPSSVVPGRWTGTQVRNGPELEAFASTVPVRALAGWSRILVLVSIADDPGLVHDKLWLGPALLAAAAGLLWLGGRTGYPVFRPVVEGSRRWRAAVEGTESAVADWTTQDIPVRVSGHGVTIGGRRRHLDEARAVLRSPGRGAAGPARATAVLELSAAEHIAMAAYDTGGLGRVERGEVVYLDGVRPALWAHWFGTDLRVTFESAADRDLAADLVSGSGTPVGSDR